MKRCCKSPHEKYKPNPTGKEEKCCKTPKTVQEDIIVPSDSGDDTMVNGCCSMLSTQCSDGNGYHTTANCDTCATAVDGTCCNGSKKSFKTEGCCEDAGGHFISDPESHDKCCNGPNDVETGELDEACCTKAGGVIKSKTTPDGETVTMCCANRGSPS